MREQALIDFISSKKKDIHRFATGFRVGVDRQGATPEDVEQIARMAAVIASQAAEKRGVLIPSPEFNQIWLAEYQRELCQLFALCKDGDSHNHRYSMAASIDTVSLDLHDFSQDHNPRLTDERQRRSEAQINNIIASRKALSNRALMQEIGETAERLLRIILDRDPNHPGCHGVVEAGALMGLSGDAAKKAFQRAMARIAKFHGHTYSGNRVINHAPVAEAAAPEHGPVVHIRPGDPGFEQVAATVGV